MVAGYWLAVLSGLLCGRFVIFLVLFWVCFAVWEVGFTVCCGWVADAGLAGLWVLLIVLIAVFLFSFVIICG